MRVAVADDAVILREGLARLLEEAGFEVVGLAGDAEELLELVDRTQPDVAIIDIRMPPTHTDEGFQAAKAIRQRWPRIGIVVLSQHVNPRYAIELLSAGTDGVGYLLKERVVRPRRAVLERAPESAKAARYSTRPWWASSWTAPAGHDPLEHLTDREREVLALMAEGRSNKAIAERLFVTEHTVEKHVKNIFGTLRLPHSPDDHRRVLALVTYLDSE